jgi:hypothetical protein
LGSACDAWAVPLRAQLLQVDANLIHTSGDIELYVGSLVVAGNLNVRSGANNDHGILDFVNGNNAQVTGQVNVVGGEIYLESGNLVAAGGTTLDTDSYSHVGDVEGPGTIASNVYNNGDFIVSDPSGGVGLLHITGSYTQPHTNATLFMRVSNGGTQYDQLQVDGAATLGDGSNPTATLLISRDGSPLTQTTLPNFVMYGSLAGTFNISGSGSYYATYGATSMTLFIVADSPSPPPGRPSTALAQATPPAVWHDLIDPTVPRPPAAPYAADECFLTPSRHCATRGEGAGRAACWWNGFPDARPSAGIRRCRAL